MFVRPHKTGLMEAVSLLNNKTGQLHSADTMLVTHIYTLFRDTEKTID